MHNQLKYFTLLLCIFAAHTSFGQSLLPYKKQIDRDLKPWINTFSNFKLGDFKATDTLPFDNNYGQDLSTLKEFLATYKPIISWSPDSTKFVDIYSYQLNLEKKGNYYYANPDIDQTIFLYIPKAKYWNRIYFGGSSQSVEEVVWLSNTRFLLAVIGRAADGTKTPFLLLGNTQTQKLVKYSCSNKATTQHAATYISPKLKRIKIKGL